jgi:hypothetical protein
MIPRIALFTQERTLPALIYFLSLIRANAWAGPDLGGKTVRQQCAEHNTLP